MKKLNIESIVMAAVLSIPIVIGTVKARMPEVNAKEAGAAVTETVTSGCTEAEIQTETEVIDEFIHQIEKPSESATEEATEPQYISLGTFTITAYCSCSLCCSQWSYNRPVDENGNPIVYGASGEELIADYSIAVDVDLIPYGEKIIINNREYIAHDCGGAINGKRIDIYMESHEKALQWGVQNIEIFKVVSNE